MSIRFERLYPYVFGLATGVIALWAHQRGWLGTVAAVLVGFLGTLAGILLSIRSRL